MLKLENIPPEQMPEVVRIASELQQRDLEQAEEEQERQSTIAAAAELGLPEKYLHQAAAELHARRVAEIRSQEQNRARFLAISLAVIFLVIGWLLIRVPSTHSTSPIPTATYAERAETALSPPFDALRWQIRTNAGTQAAATFVNGTAVVKVNRFTPDSAGRYFANLNSTTGKMDFRLYGTVSFKTHGTLPYVRLYLENGGERWRSPEIPVSKKDETVEVDLSDFERQTQSGSDTNWRNVPYEAPTTIQDLSFKTGWFVNDVNATGEVVVSDLHFK